MKIIITRTSLCRSYHSYSYANHDNNNDNNFDDDNISDKHNVYKYVSSADVSKDSSACQNLGESYSSHDNEAAKV